LLYVFSNFVLDLCGDLGSDVTPLQFRAGNDVV